jgi:hypothetical protein
MSLVMSKALLGHSITPTGRPFAQIAKLTPCSFASVFAKYLSPGPDVNR